jgi:hypothetical protein
MKNKTLFLFLFVLAPFFLSTGCASEDSPGAPQPTIAQDPLVGVWGDPRGDRGLLMLFEADGSFSVIDYTRVAATHGVEISSGGYRTRQNQLELTIYESTCSRNASSSVESLTLTYGIQGNRLRISLNGTVVFDLTRGAGPTIKEPYVGCVSNGAFTKD